MKSDHHIYKIFQNCPNLFAAFAPINEHAGYRFQSRVFKELERRYDGVMEPEHLEEPTYIFEFQVAREADVYPRIFMEMAAYQLEHPKRRVCGRLVFLNEAADPKPATWHELAKTCDGSFRVLYLIEVCEALGDEHPLTATLSPFLAKSDATVARKAKKWWSTIHRSSLTETQKNALQDVFISWMCLRLKNMNREEIMAWYDADITMKDTRVYQEIKEEVAKEYEERISSVKAEADARIASAKDEVAKAKDEAASAKNEAASAKNEAASAKDEAASAKNEVASAKDEAAKAKADVQSLRKMLDELAKKGIDPDLIARYKFTLSSNDDASLD